MELEIIMRKRILKNFFQTNHNVMWIIDACLMFSSSLMSYWSLNLQNLWCYNTREIVSYCDLLLRWVIKKMFFILKLIRFSVVQLKNGLGCIGRRCTIPLKLGLKQVMSKVKFKSTIKFDYTFQEDPQLFNRTFHNFY